MKKKILCLAMTVIMAAGVHTTAFAKDYQGADGWQVHFTGDKMESNFENKTVSDELATIQPGDSIELKVQLKNSDKGETDWYMTNEIIQTLEEAQESAEGGAYEYKLTYVGSDNTEKVLYNSDTARVLLFCVLALISGLILLAYGIYTYNKNTKKRRRKGE